MLKIHPKYIEAVVKAESAADLHPLVQEAIRLEHATIPPYLCGYFTLMPGSNEAVAEIMLSVAIQEMLHMTIASNLLIALGGSPKINDPGFVPAYPHELPMGIGGGLEVHLRKCSKAQVQDVFMAIEEPEDPIPIPSAPTLLATETPKFSTIGVFYAYLAKKIEDLGRDAFTGDTSRQVIAEQWFPDPEEMFAIKGPKTAVKAIGVIVDQGEGTSANPFDVDGDPAHYYRFEEILRGRKLVYRPGSKPPYEYGGEPVVLDDTQVWDMEDNPKAANYRKGSRSRRLADQFNYSYTMLLNALHLAFNGEPDQIDRAMGAMYELRFLAQQTLSTPADWADPAGKAPKQTGLSFEYQAVNP